MDSSTSVCITQKGIDEVKSRAYKVGMKKRSVLICLEKPHSIESLVSKSVFPPSEVMAEIQALAQDGFVTLIKAGSPLPAVASPTASNPLFLLKDEIVLPEAKFLMIDFWVDCFGMDSESFTDAIQACQSVREINACLASIVEAVKKQYPDQMPALTNLVNEINATA